MAKKSTIEIVGIIVGELASLTSDERKRVIEASLALLGEDAAASRQPAGGGGFETGEGVSGRAGVWIQQNGLSWSQIEQVFHLENGVVDVIAAEVPGKNNREKVRGAYLLAGLAQLLSSGEPKFTDKAARQLCEMSGFYDSTNHAKYIKGGNELAGSREKGWTLTGPGLKAGAVLIREIAKDA